MYRLLSLLITASLAQDTHRSSMVQRKKKKIIAILCNPFVTIHLLSFSSFFLPTSTSIRCCCVTVADDAVAISGEYHRTSRGVWLLYISQPIFILIEAKLQTTRATFIANDFNDDARDTSVSDESHRFNCANRLHKLTANRFESKRIEWKRNRRRNNNDNNDKLIGESDINNRHPEKF